MSLDQRPPKKSDSLEVRLPNETKQAFMDRCRQEGRSASAVLRGFIEDYLAGPAITHHPSPLETRMAIVKPFLRPALAATIVGLAAGPFLFAASPSSAWPDLHAAFAELDANHDGLVSQGEFFTRTRMDVFVKPGKLTELPPTAKPFTLPIKGPLPELMEGRVEPALPSRLAEEFAALDANSDTAVSFAEFENRHKNVAAEAFTSLDTNANGTIEKAEYDAATVGREPIRAIFAELDANGNGSVSADEFINAD